MFSVGKNFGNNGMIYEFTFANCFRMQLYGLQLGVSCLQLSSFAYSCVWELSPYSWIGAFLLTTQEFLLTMGKCVSEHL